MVPATHCYTLGDYAFPLAGAGAWNVIPLSVTSAGHVILNIIPPGLLRESSLPNSFNFLRHTFDAVFIINMSHSKHMRETKQA